jgi:C-terminal processing protease CtpA/Prc
VVSAAVKRLGGDVGYLKVTGFPDAERGGPTVAAAMMFLTRTDALIIDLRRNRGGEPEMVDLLASYFFDESREVSVVRLCGPDAESIDARFAR